jgi:hypothetical protein
MRTTLNSLSCVEPPLFAAEIIFIKSSLDSHEIHI